MIDLRIIPIEPSVMSFRAIIESPVASTIGSSVGRHIPGDQVSVTWVDTGRFSLLIYGDSYGELLNALSAEAEEIRFESDPISKAKTIAALLQRLVEANENGQVRTSDD